MFQQLMVIPMSIYANRHTFLDDPLTEVKFQKRHGLNINVASDRLVANYKEKNTGSYHSMS